MIIYSKVLYPLSSCITDRHCCWQLICVCSSLFPFRRRRHRYLPLFARHCYVTIALSPPRLSVCQYWLNGQTSPVPIFGRSELNSKAQRERQRVWEGRPLVIAWRTTLQLLSFTSQSEMVAITQDLITCEGNKRRAFVVSFFLPAYKSALSIDLSYLVPLHCFRLSIVFTADVPLSTYVQRLVNFRTYDLFSLY